MPTRRESYSFPLPVSHSRHFLLEFNSKTSHFPMCNFNRLEKCYLCFWLMRKIIYSTVTSRHGKVLQIECLTNFLWQHSTTKLTKSESYNKYCSSFLKSKCAYIPTRNIIGIENIWKNVINEKTGITQFKGNYNHCELR